MTWVQAVRPPAPPGLGGSASLSVEAAGFGKSGPTGLRFADAVAARPQTHSSANPSGSLGNKGQASGLSG